MYSDDFEKFHPRTYLEFSKILYENLDNYKTSEALYSAAKRTIVDRIYQASFLMFRRYIEEYYNYPPNTVRPEHAEKLIENGGFFKGRDNKKIYDYFYILKKNRFHCEYSFKKPNTNESSLGWSLKTIDELFIISEHIFDLIEKYEE